MTNDQWREQQEAFAAALDDFEECANTPVVPGEFRKWMQSLTQSFQRLLNRSERQRKQVHSEEFQEIAEEDPGLLQRVAQLREEDQAVAGGEMQLAKQLASLSKQAAAADWDEAALGDQRARLTDAARELVTRTRAQEVAVRTWLQEVFTRDRGTVD